MRRTPLAFFRRSRAHGGGSSSSCVLARDGHAWKLHAGPSRRLNTRPLAQDDRSEDHAKVRVTRWQAAGLDETRAYLRPYCSRLLSRRKRQPVRFLRRLDSDYFGRTGMEPTGIEPVTSCLQNAGSRPGFRPRRRRIAGLPRRGCGGATGADARGLPAIVVVSGTSGDKCLDDPKGRGVHAVAAT
jgi:hypothetical protein